MGVLQGNGRRFHVGAQAAGRLQEDSVQRLAADDDLFARQAGIDGGKMGNWGMQRDAAG
jgi:hypothetical protein